MGETRVPVRLTERICTWSVAGICVIMTAGFLIARFIPPPNPAASDRALKHTYLAHADMTRVGITLLTIGGVFILPFGAAISAHLRRIEGPGSTMAFLQLGAAAFVATATMIYLFMMFVLTYRQNRPVDDIRLVNDIAWIAFIGMWQPGALQAAAVVGAVFGDRDPSRPGHWPRWVGWVSLWYIVASLIGFFVPFTSGGGPLSWNGAIPFYLGAAALFGWWSVIAVVMLRTTRVATVDELVEIELGR